MYAEPPLPPVIIHEGDFNDLILAGAIAERLGHPFAAPLLAKLRGAQLCAVGDLPSDVVSIGSCVTYRVGSAVARHRLCNPKDRHFQGLCVTTPLGTALVGLKVGTQASFAAEDGCLRVVTVERVDKSPNEPTNSREALDRRLDQALEQTFPASDPVSVVCTPAS